MKTHNLKAEEISLMTSRVQDDQAEVDKIDNENLTLKNLLPMPNHTNQLNLTSFKFLDENVTISCSSNPNEDRTPVTLENIKNLTSCKMRF